MLGKPSPALAETLPPSRTGPMLREGALKGVAEAGPVPLPEPPFGCEVTFVGTSSAVLAAMVPTVRRHGPRGVAFDANSVDALYRCLRVVVKPPGMSGSRTAGRGARQGRPSPTMRRGRRLSRGFCQCRPVR